ncbi:MAG TPA: CT253 family lipoprotein [Rhabdochlamydiaceae bacterium]|nr:CT253 family lipoprotein [Rhabdochlamydiaceae bacterium]
MKRCAVFLGSISLIFTLGGCYYSGNLPSILSEARASNRPIVSFVPVIDHSKSDLNWNVSQELTKAIRDRLAQKKRVYMVGEDHVAALSQKALSAHTPFEGDTSWVRRSFPESEFVVFMELMEHDEIPAMPKEPQDSPADLTMALRVVVVDVREKTPKVVLQEIVEQSHHIPRQFNKANLNQVPQVPLWGDEAFDVSPLGIAHDQLCKEVATRVEDYILIAGVK